MITLVLLPGMDGTGLLLSEFVASLGSSARTVVVSYPTDRVLNYAALESVARSSLPQNEPFILLGESFSGPIAISIASTAPSGLRGLVLSTSFARNPRPVFSALRHLIRLVPVRLLPRRALTGLLLGRHSSKPLSAALAQALDAVSPSVLRARLEAVLDVDVCTELIRVAVPVLYLRATEDRVVPRSSAELICRLSPRSRSIDVEGPHFLLQAMPSIAAFHVHAFVREMGAA